MATFTEVAALIPTLGAHLAEDARAGDLPAMASHLSDAEIIDVLAEVADVVGMLDQARLAVIGVAAARSTRERGRSGLAQSRGHRNAVDLVQKITGSSKAEAARDVRVGSAMFEEGFEGSEAGFDVSGAGFDDDGAEADAGAGSEGGAGAGAESDAGAGAGAGADDGSADAGSPPSTEWFVPLCAALRSGAITAAQFDAIRGGLGEPPTDDGADGDAIAAAIEAWRCAAEMLVLEAGERTLEELRSAARALRDELDPEGALARFQANYEARSFRMWRDAEGRRRASISFDDEGGAFLDSVLSAALRPRRGGPRFVDSEEKARASALSDDPRTNDQLSYDLVLDLIRAGALADAESVFGTRQAGVRLVQVVAADGVRSPVAHTEDGLSVFPGAVAAQHACASGYVPVTIDSCGNPLDVGREQRLFTPRQRIAMAIRDGGCRWRGCDRPASYCEAHHIDEWAGGGKTDVDRGILLCRFHHMTLHHSGWRIVREGRGDFVLLRAGDDPVILKPRAALMYTWADAWPDVGVDPPPQRFRPAA